jgi:hypothetical protein
MQFSASHALIVIFKLPSKIPEDGGIEWFEGEIDILVGLPSMKQLLHVVGRGSAT